MPCEIEGEMQLCNGEGRKSCRNAWIFRGLWEETQLFARDAAVGVV